MTEVAMEVHRQIMIQELEGGIWRLEEAGKKPDYSATALTAYEKICDLLGCGKAPTPARKKPGRKPRAVLAAVEAKRGADDAADGVIG